MDIRKAMEERVLFFDGGMGTMVQRAGLKAGQQPEVYNIIYPEIITSIHKAYGDAGADIITTNTFGANPYKLQGTGYTVEEVVEQKVKTAFLPLKDTEVELLEATSPESPVAKFIEAKGEGIHHMAIRVDDLEATLAELKEKGIRLIDEKPRLGAGGAKIAFIHPKATGGILLELSER